MAGWLLWLAVAGWLLLAGWLLAGCLAAWLPVAGLGGIGVVEVYITMLNHRGAQR